MSALQNDRTETQANFPAQINAYAVGLADDTKAWDQQAVLDLAQLLINFDGLPSPVRAREARLGLLVELITREPASSITAERYREAVREEKAAGRVWPSPDRLAVEYGSWIKALELAGSLARNERRGISHSHRNRGHQECPYSRADLIGAVIQCMRAVGYWPSGSDYSRWANSVRREDRAKGGDGKSVPCGRTIVNHVGSWERVLQLARKEVALAVEEARAGPGG